MPPPGFQILLNEALLSTVVAMPTPERRRFREKVEYLGAGLWDTGVRVKKLKGLSRKVVFEARVSRGDRLLFTLGRDRERSLVYLWSLVTHDDVGRVSRRAGATNAPFLHYESAETEERQELSLDEVSEDTYTQEPLVEKVREEYGPQKWLVLDDREWERLLRASPGDDLSVHLYLTPEQERVLATDPPLLLSGTAGSGKTTICSYYLLRPEPHGSRRVFVTYTVHLKRFSQRLYHALVLHGAGTAGPEPEFVTLRELVSGLLDDRDAEVWGYREFERIYRTLPQARSYDPELVWEEIRAIIKGAKPAASARRLRELAEAWLRGVCPRRDLDELQALLLDLRLLAPFRNLGRLVGDYEAHVRGMGERRPGELDRRVLGEAMSTADRRHAGLEAPLLSLEEYLELGTRRAPNFRYDRKAIYDLAVRYQEKLTAAGAEDDVDRARRALGRIARGTVALYDLVVCDEVQDLCDLETTLLVRLAGRPGSVVFAGDLKQSINPSGFRWEEIRRSFYERGQTPPEVVELGLNFRCVGSVVRLANALLALKARLVGLQGAERPEDWKFNGRPPLLLAGPAEEAALAHVDLRSAGRIVIVRTPEEKRRLGALLRSELVFTIYEAKGLEFDTVLVWRFLEGPETAALWRRVLGDESATAEHEPHLRHELNLLYVALTRARNGLLIYDGQTSCPLWDRVELRGLVVRSADPTALEVLGRHVSTPEEWADQGVYFEEREYWAAAEECFRNAGQGGRAEIARARGHAAAGRHAEAAELYERNGLRAEAAFSWEKADELERALELWRSLGDTDRFRRCRVRLYAKRGDYTAAAEEWEKLGNRDEALRCWVLAGRWDRVGSLWLQWKQYRRAAEAFERGKLHREAAEAWERCREHERAADHYARARVWDRAAALYRKAGNEDRLLECLRRIPDHLSVADLLEKRGDLGGAVSALRRHLETNPTEEKRLRADLAGLGDHKPSPARIRAAAVRAAALGEHAVAAAHFEAAGLPELAYQEWAAISDAPGMARALAARGRPADAARLLEERAPELRDLVEGYLRVSLAGPGGEPEPAKLEQMWREAERMEHAGDLEAALNRVRLFDDPQKLADLYLKLDHDEEALDRLTARGELEPALRFVTGKARLGVSAASLERKVAELARSTRDRIPQTLAELYAAVFLKCLDRGPEYAGPANLLLDLAARRGLTGSGESAYQEELAMRLAHAPMLLTLLGADPLRGDSGSEQAREHRGGLVERIRREEAVRPGGVLEACRAFVEEPEVFERLVAAMEVTDRTVCLHELSSAGHAKAVERHLAKGDWERAVHVHLGWREWREAARIREANGDPRGACRIYRRYGEHALALRCARGAGDEVEMARAYEGLGEYRRALDLWSSLGRSRDVSRLRRTLEGRTAGEPPGQPGRTPTA